MNAKAQLFVAVLLAALGAAVQFGGLGALPENIRSVVAPYATTQTQMGLYIAAGVYATFAVLTALFNLAFDPSKASQRRDRRAEAEALDAFHEILTGATVRMVGADGVVSDAELTMVRSVLKKFGQRPVGDDTIRSIANAAHADPQRYVELIKEKREIITAEQKSQILRGCLLVAMSDIMVDPAELDYLRLVAEALGLDEGAIRAVQADLQNVAQQLVGVASATL